MLQSCLYLSLAVFESFISLLSGRVFLKLTISVNIRYSSTMDYVKSAVAQNFGGPSHSLAPADQQFSLEEVPDLSGKVAVVTGGSEGIGYGYAHTILAHNISKLFILSKSEEIVDGALDATKEETGASAAEKVTWIKCSLTDWPTVTTAASQISNSSDRLDILTNTAARGIITFQLSPYGVDEHMALNHMGH
jgi:hypothetical protein